MHLCVILSPIQYISRPRHTKSETMVLVASSLRAQHYGNITMCISSEILNRGLVNTLMKQMVLVLLPDLLICIYFAERKCATTIEEQDYASHLCYFYIILS